jgi:hypothetical protein
MIHLCRRPRSAQASRAAWTSQAEGAASGRRWRVSGTALPGRCTSPAAAETFGSARSCSRRSAWTSTPPTTQARWSPRSLRFPPCGSENTPSSALFYFEGSMRIKSVVLTPLCLEYGSEYAVRLPCQVLQGDITVRTRTPHY